MPENSEGIDSLFSSSFRDRNMSSENSPSFNQVPEQEIGLPSVEEELGQGRGARAYREIQREIRAELENTLRDAREGRAADFGRFFELRDERKDAIEDFAEAGFVDLDFTTDSVNRMLQHPNTNGLNLEEQLDKLAARLDEPTGVPGLDNPTPQMIQGINRFVVGLNRYLNEPLPPQFQGRDAVVVINAPADALAELGTITQGRLDYLQLRLYGDTALAREGRIRAQDILEASLRIDRRQDQQVAINMAPQIAPAIGNSVGEAIARSRAKAEAQQFKELMPSEHWEQLMYVRQVLEVIESTPVDSSEEIVGNEVTKLETAMDRMHPSIRTEVKARISVHECSELVRRANGFIENPETRNEISLPDALSRAEGTHRALDAVVIETLLNPDDKDNVGLQDHNVQLAWNLIQDANYNYLFTVQQVNQAFAAQGDLQRFEERGFEPIDDEDRLGRTPSTFYTDSNVARKEAVREYIIRQIENSLQLSPEAAQKLRGINTPEALAYKRACAEKSFTIAEDLLLATLENSVFNRYTLAGNDQLAEAIRLKFWRKARNEREAGPQIHIDAIEGFGNSWIRSVRRSDRNNPNDKLDVVNIDRPFYASDIDIRKIKAQSYSIYGARVSQFNQLKKLFLNMKAYPTDVVSRKWMGDAENLIQKVDDKVDANLRLWLIAGIFDVELSREVNEKDAWRPEDFGKVMSALTNVPLSERAGSFLTKEEMNWIAKAANVNRRNAARSARAGFQQGWGGGGGKKR